MVLSIAFSAPDSSLHAGRRSASLRRRKARARLRALAIGGLLSLAPLSASAAVADQAQAAHAFVQHLGDQVMEIIKTPNDVIAERQKRFRELFTENFDAPRIARFVLGQYWAKLSDDEKKTYLDLFATYVAAVYAIQYSHYNGASFKILGERADGADDVEVDSEITQPDKVALHMSLRVRATEPLKVEDVTVDDESLIINMRKEFAAVVAKEGTQGLMTRLKGLVIPLNAPIVQK